MSRVDKEAFERALEALGKTVQEGAGWKPDADHTPFTSFMSIDTGCQVAGCARRSRVVIVVIQRKARPGGAPDCALSFVCNKHARHIVEHAEDGT